MEGLTIHSHTPLVAFYNNRVANKQNLHPME